MRHTLAFHTLCILLTISLSAAKARADLPADVRKELGSMSKEARTVTRLVRTKKIDEAKALIEKLEERAAELNIDDGERDRVWRTFQQQLERARSQLPVSFETDVAPILSTNCTRCHGTDRASARLRLDTFNGLRAGGRSGMLLQPGRPRNSLIMGRLTARDDEQRMPRNADRLPDAELSIIARWIAGGAGFDGEDQDAPIGSSAEESDEPVTVPMARAADTVSFKNDVAPLLVTFCLRCHRGNEPRGGFSVVTIQDILRGGDSGDTIVPGKANDSYLWKLVWDQDPIKMPQGQALLRRSQAQTIKRWIDEGARYDGGDVNTSIRDLVPTAEEQAAEQLTAMSDDDFSKRRIQQASDMWKRVVPRDKMETATTANFYVCGNVSADRLKQLGNLAETQVTRLSEQFGGNTDGWRGRLILFVTKDRFDYTEFNTVLREQRTPPTTHGHVVLTAQLDTAYAVIHDRGDTDSEQELSTEQLLNSLVAQAWLARDGAAMPDWLQQGFGLLQAGVSPRAQRQLKLQARRAAQTITDPSRLFDNGTLPPADVAVLGASMVQFLQTQGPRRFREYLQAVRSADSFTQAVTEAYGQPAEDIARAFLTRLAR